jgi:hypothetical protein
MTNLFISYRDSADAAETQFRKLIEGFLRPKPLVPFGKDFAGWSRMLPGVICDLWPEESHRKTPSVFIGLFSQQSLLSFALCEPRTSDLPSSMLNYLKMFDIGEHFGHSRLLASPRLDFLSEIVTGTVRIQGLSAFPDFSTPPALDSPIRPFGFADGIGLAPHCRFNYSDPYEDQSEFSRADPIDSRIGDLMGLLSSVTKETNYNSVLRDLVRNYHCRFAWASLQLDELGQDSEAAAGGVNPALDRPSLAPPQITDEIRNLRSFWENRTLLDRSPDYTVHMPFAEYRPASSWPYWVQFLILISNAGRHPNARFRKYNFSKALKRRRFEGAARKPNRGLRSPDDSTEPETIGHLFRGGFRAAPEPLHPEFQGNKPDLKNKIEELARDGDLRLKPRPSLIKPGRDSIQSLFRGGSSSVARKPQNET